MPEDQSTFQSNDTNLAAFLLAKGHRLLSSPMGVDRAVRFHFAPEAAADVPGYEAGEFVSAKALLRARQKLRDLVIQIRRIHEVAQ